MDRQEPVIDLERSERNAKTLTDRIRLTWREVRDLMTDAPDDLPKEPTLGTAPATERAAKAPAADRAAAPVAATVATAATAATAANEATDTLDAPAEIPDVATAAAEAQQPAAPAPREPEPLRLTDEEKEAIVKRIAPQVEAAVRSALDDPAEEWPEWRQPQGAHDAYALGAKVSHNGKHWTSDVAANVWEPGVYGWTEVA